MIPIPGNIAKRQPSKAFATPGMYRATPLTVGCIVKDTEPVPFVGIHLDLSIRRGHIIDLRVDGRSVVLTLRNEPQSKGSSSKGYSVLLFR